MAYCERILTREEITLAQEIRDEVDRTKRLYLVQRVCEVAEDLRDKANEASGFDRKVWDSLHFPRYRFFDVALPNEGWAQFAECDD